MQQIDESKQAGEQQKQMKRDRKKIQAKYRPKASTLEELQVENFSSLSSFSRRYQPIIFYLLA